MRMRVPTPLLLAALICLTMLAAAPAPAEQRADSVILFIGDGMGPGQVDLARQAASGSPLEMERMPISGIVTTHSANQKVTDSAAAGTALATGRKTNNGMISVSPEGVRLETILERCQAARKSAGIITTDALHGATPAAFAAHVPSRGQAAEIAKQMAHSRAQVMMGFWKNQFLPEAAGGSRKDGLDLIAQMRRAGYDVVFTKEELAKARRPGLVGLFDDGEHAPTLAEMVRAALSRLGADANGFFLMVEGARIDWFCHDNDPAGSVRDTWQFDQAVGVGLDYARRRGRTLVVVTADHETGGLRLERPAKAHALGPVKGSSAEIASHLNKDRSNTAQVMTEWAGISDLTPEQVQKIKTAEDPAGAVAAVLSERAGLSWSTKGHTATPVRVFAFGPGSERFAGEMDNTDIPKRIAAALNLGAFPR